MTTKKNIRPLMIFGTSLLLVISCAALAYSTQSSSMVNTTGAGLFFQTTSTPQPVVDKSEVGSTDGIVMMGGVITLIVLVPILARRKAWMKS